MRSERARVATLGGTLALALALGLAFLLPACSGETVAQPPPAPVNWASFARPAPASPEAAPPDARSRALAQSYTSALASPAFAALGPLADDDARATFPGLRDGHGRDALVHLHDQLFGAFDQRHFVATRVLRTPTAQTQAIEWTMTGTQARPWLGLAPSQKTVAIQGVTLLTAKSGGSIVETHVYFDVAGTQARLGGGPKELAALAGAAGLASVAPAEAPASAADVIDAAPEDADNVAVARASLDALESNEAAYVASFTDDVELWTLERSEPLRGPVLAARAYYNALHKAIAQLDTTTSGGLSAKAFAVVEYTISGEQVGPIGWVPRQRDPVVRLHVLEVDELRDGKIARVWRYDNPLELVGVAGSP